MNAPPLTARIASLQSHDILDTAPEPGFDRLAKLASWVCETPVALVSFVSFDRQWFKAKIGFDADETPLDSSVCRHVVAERRLLVIPDLTQDPRTRDNPLVTRDEGIRFYAGAPLVAADGEVLGALCVIDSQPRPQGLTDRQAEALSLLAEEVMVQVELRRLKARGDKALFDERGASVLREQFIAVLGHDLRNPLAAISAGVRLLQRDPSKARAVQLAGMMQDSVARMAGLIDNVLDFARGRLGGGLSLNRRPVDLAAVVLQVVEELRASYPAFAIGTDIDLPAQIDCDGPRVAQLLSNLVGNACVHGRPEGPVRVQASIVDAALELSVSNAGEPIPSAKIATLFEPFTRGSVAGAPQGLGLGLFIAREIAKAHGGALSVASSSAETVFRFRMPLV